MANLREEIFNLTNPAPKFRDPEDEVDEGIIIFSGVMPRDKKAIYFLRVCPKVIKTLLFATL